MKKVDVLIAGAGITGITAASVLAREKDKTVLVVDKRPHIGGNCYDCINQDGILIHLYGPHIFHTCHKDVWDYLSRFTDWTDYVHHVKAFVDGEYMSFPININTFEQLFDKPFSKAQVIAYLEKEKCKLSEIKNAEDMVISRMGKTIYEKFFKKYTQKQWGLSARQLSPEVTKRIPIRFNRDDRFFTDPYQGLPAKGYSALFAEMLNHKNISVMTGTDFREIKNNVQFDRLVYTGPIDEYFDYMHGMLPYRGIDFKFKTYNREKYLPAPVINYPNNHAYTRATEFRQMTFQKHSKTTVCYEYPSDLKKGKNSPVPSYPKLDMDSARILDQYMVEADKNPDIIFMGRLAKFKYLNMDDCVKQVMDTLNMIIRS